MDEHIKVAGPTMDFRGALIDDSPNSLTWWTDKHNRNASREAVDLLNLKYGFLPIDSVASLSDGSQASLKRWIKERVHARLPAASRAFAYFFYRYVIRLGFLDGQAGIAFHVLQGFWYRYVVDAKVAEVERYMRKQRCDVVEVLAAVLDIQLERPKQKLVSSIDYLCRSWGAARASGCGTNGDIDRYRVLIVDGFRFSGEILSLKD